MGNKLQKKRNKILVVVILYKMNLLDSQTIKTLKEQQQSSLEIELIVWDNSPNPHSKESLVSAECNIGDFKYISTPENMWLSKIYNNVVKNYNYDYILLFDQDTSMPRNYFKSISIAIEEHNEIMLFLPLVRSEGILVSPGSFWFFKGKHWEKEKTGILKSNKTVAITSGMLISREYFNKYDSKFDERLNLYGIDTKFMLNYSKNESFLYVMNTTLSHNTVLWSNPPAEIMLDRFRNFRRAYSILFSDNKFLWGLTNLYTTYVSIKLVFKYRDFRFLLINDKNNNI